MMDPSCTPILAAGTGRPRRLADRRRPALRRVALAALCLGTALLAEDLVWPHGSPGTRLVALGPTAALRVATHAVAVAVAGTALTADPALADPSLLESLNAPYKSGAEQLREQRRGDGEAAPATPATRRGSRAQTDAAEELRKRFLGETEAPEPAAPAAKPAPRGFLGLAPPTAAEKVAAPAPKAEGGKAPPRPLLEGIPSRPTTLPKLPDTVTTATAPAAPAPAKAAPKPAAAPTKPTAEAPKKAEGPKKFEAPKKAEALKKAEDLKKAEAAKKAEPPKAVTAKAAPKPEAKKKDEGGNPFLGPLLVLGGLYGLGATSEKEDAAKGKDTRPKDGPKDPESPV